MAKKDKTSPVQLGPEDLLVRMNRRGQILISENVRRATGIQGGDLVMITPEKDGLRIIKIVDEEAIRQVILNCNKIK